MARIIPAPIAQWLRDDPNPTHDEITSRAVTIRRRHDGQFAVSLRGGDHAGRRVTSHSIVSERESGISGGGSMPDGWTRAVNAFKEATGETVHRGPS